MARNCNRFYYCPVTSQDLISAAVTRLSQALTTRVPCAPVRDLIGTDDLPAAYAAGRSSVPIRSRTGAHGTRVVSACESRVTAAEMRSWEVTGQ